MNYERPSAETSSTDKDKSSRKKKSVEAALARTIANAETTEVQAEAPAPKRAWELGRFVGRLVPEPKAEEHPTNPFDALAPRSDEKKPKVERQPEHSDIEEAKEDAPDKRTAEPSSVEGPASQTSVEARDEQRGEAVDDSELAHIEDDEQSEVANRLIEPRLEAVQAEQEATEPDSVEAQAAEADAAFLEEVQAQVNDGASLEDATAAAFPKVMGVEAPPLSEVEEENAGEVEPDEGQAPEHDTDTTPLEALDFPPSERVNDDDPYAAAYAAGYAGGNGGGYGGGAPGGIPGGRAPYQGRERTGKEPKVEVNGVASGLLVGGIVGYLLGRRRGRIKTERRLLPVQRELEKQVRSLHDHLAIREAQVRKLALERAAEQSAPAVAAEAVQVSARERAPKPVAIAEHAQPAPEKKAEATAAAKPEQARAKDLPLKQVLDISETIVVGSTTIRRVYETNLIEEAGLRRIVDEHLRGGDVHKVLTEELMIKELSYERDPLMNPRPGDEQEPRSVQGASAGTIGSMASANPLMQQAPSDDPAGRQSSSAPSPFNQQRPISSALVLANIAALAILAVLLTILLIVWLTR